MFDITTAFHVWLSLGQGCTKEQAALGRDWYQSMLAVARSDLANLPDIAQMLRLHGSQQMAPLHCNLKGAVQSADTKDTTASIHSWNKREESAYFCPQSSA